jgi:tetratricopeptide (TPR) repeat protein
MAEDIEEEFVEASQETSKFESCRTNKETVNKIPWSVENPLALDYPLPSTPFQTPMINLDLETLAENYAGYDRIERLLFIAAHFPPHEIESLRLAALELHSSSLDAGRYGKVLLALQEAEHRHQRSPSASLDLDFIQSATIKAQSIMKRLEEGYREAREGGIAESIRQALLELAEHCIYCGDFPKALDYYLRTRDFASKPSHKFLTCLHVAHTYWRLKRLDKAIIYATKASKLESHVRDEKPILLKFHLLRSLLHLCAGEWNEVSKHLSSAQTFGLPPTSCGLSISDMSTYANLCNLASLSRDELMIFGKDDSSNVKDMLRYSSEAREATKAFVLMRPAKYLDLLNRLKVE